MIAELLIAVTIGQTAAAATTAQPALENVIGFDDPARCEPNHAFRDLLHGMLTTSEGGEVLRGEPVVPPALRDAFGRPRHTVSEDGTRKAIAAVRGTWLGLPVTAIGHSLVPNTGVGGRSIAFAAPIGLVESRLRAFGIPVRAHRMVDGATDGMSAYVRLSRQGRGSLLECFT